MRGEIVLLITIGDDVGCAVFMISGDDVGGAVFTTSGGDVGVTTDFVVIIGGTVGTSGTTPVGNEGIVT